MKYQNNEEMKLRKKLLMLGLVERESTLICMNLLPPLPLSWMTMIKIAGSQDGTKGK